MKRRTTLALLLGAATLAQIGCASYYYGDRAAGTDRTDLVEANYRATDMLLLDAPLDPRQPVLVATLVNVDRLTESSRLGRIFSEQIASRMVQRGLRVTELKLREHLSMHRDQGELLLSREIREVSQAQDAQAVVVGTYAVSANRVYISLKLVNPAGNTMVAAHDYALPVDENVRVLLTGR
ncbi:MAG: FlgO family outer membrane protein [Burkholderiaceae bacterium]|nr:FlgO family outer membrane protein [Burkholderiaceae bacterium]